MLAKLKENPAIEKLIAQYDHMPRRDQKALLALVVAVFLGILYFAIWQPVHGFHERSLAARENAGELLAWMQANEATIKRLGGAGDRSGAGVANTPDDGRALMALATQSARDAGLSLQRFEPSGDDAIRIWLEGVAFAEVAAWLENLNSAHGVQVDQASFDRASEPGRVSVRLTLAI